MLSKSKNNLAVNQTLKIFFAEPEWTYKVGIGCLINGAAFGLLLFNIAMLPICFCLWSFTSGYILETINSKYKDPKSKLPAWSNLIELVMGGGTWIAVSVLHFLPLLLLAFTALFVGQFFDLDNVVSQAFLPWSIIMWSLFMLLLPLISFFSFYLMVNFALKQDIKAAFALKDIVAKLAQQKRELSQAWLINLGLLYLAILLPILTLLGLFAIPSTLFFTQVLGACLATSAWQSENLVD